jgi:hypothetical protein
MHSRKTIEPTAGPYRTVRLFSKPTIPPLPSGIVAGQGADYRVLAVIVPNGTETDEDLANAALMSRAWQMRELLESAAEEIAILHDIYRNSVGRGQPCVNGVVIAIRKLLADIRVDQ